MTESAVASRVRAGRLHRVHQGVYAVGHVAPSRERTWMAAVLAGGEIAVLSHRSAAALWGMLKVERGLVDIAVPSLAGKKKRQGIRLHRSRTLTPDLTTRHKGIPVTRPSRTIADLRSAVSAKELRRAIRQAEVLGLSLGTEAVPDRTRSDLELIFLRLCRRHRLPEPEINIWIERMQVDFLWPDRRLIVETDGYEFHRGKAAFEADRERDLRLRALGYEVIRLTYKQVTNDPGGVAVVLGERLR